MGSFLKRTLDPNQHDVTLGGWLKRLEALGFRYDALQVILCFRTSTTSTFGATRASVVSCPKSMVVTYFSLAAPHAECDI